MLSQLSKNVYRRACWFFDRVANRVVPFDVCQIRLLDLNRTTKPVVGPAYSFRFMETDELPTHVSNSAADLGNPMCEILAQPNIRCFAAFEGDVLLGYAWTADDKVSPEHNSGGHRFTGIGLKLPSDVAYLFKCFVLPEFRGRGINKQLLWHLSQLLKLEGKSNLVTTTSWLNFPFQSSSDRLGFRKVGSSAECILFGKRLYRWTELNGHDIEMYRPESQSSATPSAIPVT